MTTSPDSSGWRRVCSTVPLNSGASSRNSTPWWAREIAPGRATPDPPPATAATEALWCGATNGGVRSSVDDLTDLPGERADRVGLERLLAAQRRQHRDQPLGEHRLADPGRPGHQQVVASGRRQLERQPRLRLPDDVGEVGPARVHRPGRRAAGRQGQGRAVLGGARTSRRRRAGRRRRAPSRRRRAGPRRRSRRAPRRARRPTVPPRAPRAARRGHRRTRPSSASSPRCTTSRDRLAGITPAAESTATAIGRSKHAPRLGIEAGERLTVTRCGGHGHPARRRRRRGPGRAPARRRHPACPPIAKCGRPCGDVRLDVDQRAVEP